MNRRPVGLQALESIITILFWHHVCDAHFVQDATKEWTIGFIIVTSLPTDVRRTTIGIHSLTPY